MGSLGTRLEIILKKNLWEILKSWLLFTSSNIVPVGNSMPGSSVSLACISFSPGPRGGPGFGGISGRMSVSILQSTCREGKALEAGEEFRTWQQFQGNSWWTLWVDKAHATYIVWFAAFSASLVPNQKNLHTSYQWSWDFAHLVRQNKWRLQYASLSFHDLASSSPLQSYG